jgi:DHA2 family multidrug resistance protein
MSAIAERLKPARRTDAAPHEWTPSFNPWLIAAAVMLATFMEVLDTSVANVALPHIAGNLSATPEEATWVLTSYLVSNAIILPAANWLGRYFGRKRFLIVCITLFTLSSALCGAATSLGMLVVARIAQGAGGGALQPIAQAVLMESFPVEKRGSAMAVFGLGVVVAPIIGPTLGGWITDNYSWRWIFYINLPIGILAIFMARTFIVDRPYI